MRYYTILVIILVSVFAACKKDKKEPAPTPTETPAPASYDFTLTTMPNQTGNQWVYVHVITTTVQTINGPNSNTVTYTNNYTSTVTVIGDTLLTGNMPGKILLNDFGVPNANYKEVSYLNTNNNLFYIIPIDTLKGFKAFSIKIPLTKNMFWQNTNLTPLDTSYATGTEHYFNGIDYYNVINIERTKDLFYKDYFKVNQKGIVVHKNDKLEFLGMQVKFTRSYKILTETNF